MSGERLWIPGRADADRRVDRLIADAERGARKCPAATLGRYADSRRGFVKCEIESVPGMPATIPIEENLLSCTHFCLGEHGDCPVWRSKDDDKEKVERVIRARRRAVAAKERQRQIALGIRVDDQGEEERLAAEALQRAEQEARMGAMSSLVQSIVHSGHDNAKPKRRR